MALVEGERGYPKHMRDLAFEGKGKRGLGSALSAQNECNFYLCFRNIMSSLRDL